MDSCMLMLQIWVLIMSQETEPNFETSHADF